MLLHPSRDRKCPRGKWDTTDKATENSPSHCLKNVEKQKKKGGMIKNSELSRVARLLNEFLMLQQGAKTAHFFGSTRQTAWILGRMMS